MALVTGASHGIGAATARLLASLGAIAGDISAAQGKLAPWTESARPTSKSSP